jgi:hypothetical protein
MFVIHIFNVQNMPLLFIFCCTVPPEICLMQLCTYISQTKEALSVKGLNTLLLHPWIINIRYWIDQHSMPILNNHTRHVINHRYDHTARWLHFIFPFLFSLWSLAMFFMSEQMANIVITLPPLNTVSNYTISS